MPLPLRVSGWKNMTWASWSVTYEERLVQFVVRGLGDEKCHVDDEYVVQCQRHVNLLKEKPERARRVTLHQETQPDWWQDCSSLTTSKTNGKLTKCHFIFRRQSHDQTLHNTSSSHPFTRLFIDQFRSFPQSLSSVCPSSTMARTNFSTPAELRLKTYDHLLFDMTDLDTCNMSKQGERSRVYCQLSWLALTDLTKWIEDHGLQLLATSKALRAEMLADIAARSINFITHSGPTMACIFNKLHEKMLKYFSTLLVTRIECSTFAFQSRSCNDSIIASILEDGILYSSSDESS